MNLETGAKLVFIGDSITDCGRTGQFPPFGQGYVAFLRSLFLVRRPDLKLKFVNHGISGNTIRDLAARWDTGVLAEQPDLLSVMIGINDIWRGFVAAERAEFHVPLAEFRETYRDLVARSRAAGIGRIVLCGAFFVEPNREEPMRRMCEDYNGAVADLAGEAGCEYVDMQAVFDRFLEHQHPMAIAADRVHPESFGHLAMAEELWRRLDGGRG